MKNKLLSVCTISAASLLVASFAWAKPPFTTPPKGGLPQCKADLEVCNSDLGQTQAETVACQNNLMACEDTLAAIEPEILVIDDAFVRRPPFSISGDGVSTVEANCPADPGGNGWQGATATLKVKQKGAGSTVEIEVEDAVPNTVFDVWLRIKGGPGFNDAGSPLTGGGSTPLAPGTELDALNAISPWVDPAGASSSTNSFTTDGDGNSSFTVDLDFPVVGGAYPFQKASGERPGQEAIPNVPTAIVDPRTGNGGPYLIRVLSHCTDQVIHGLSPATREAWFQYP